MLFAACKKKPPPITASDDYTFQSLDVGLSAEEQLELWHTSEGSDLFPVVILQALNDADTGKPIIESMVNYGFLPSKVDEKWNPYGLPVGWSTHVPAGKDKPYVGLNCAACHSGQIEYAGKQLRIDGAPNMVDLEKWILLFVRSIERTLSDPAEAIEFVVRVAKGADKAGEADLSDGAIAFLERLSAGKAASPGMGQEFFDAAEEAAPAGDQAEDLIEGIESKGVDLAAPEEAHARESMAAVSPYLTELKTLLAYLNTLQQLKQDPQPGPGRDDPWGIIRNTVYQDPTPLTAPTSIPHLFHTGEVDWFHADGNTDSLLDRNIAQGLALGAKFNPQTQVATLLVANVERLQDLVQKLKSPKWPGELLGSIDQAKAERGGKIFEQRKFTANDGKGYTCAECHKFWKSQLYSLDLLGTDRNRAANFLQPLDGMPFAAKVMDSIPPITKATFDAQGVQLDPQRPNSWRGTGEYVARQLGGVWATAPYLHNGSVPTLYHLLLPAAERPKQFHLGHRRYDPEHVGYEIEVEKPIFVYDVDTIGGSNSGHEFGTDLTEEERWEVVEYLKTL